MLTPVETLEAIKTASIKKSTSSASRLLILGFLAGLMIAFAALVSTIASMNLLADPSTLASPSSSRASFSLVASSWSSSPVPSFSQGTPS